MAFRKFNTGTWQDPWFESLSKDAKLLFVYLWTNETCNPAGMYKITQKRILFDCGIDITKHISELAPKVTWTPADTVIWVKNFFRHQRQNDKFSVAAVKSIECLSPKYRHAFHDYNKEILDKDNIPPLTIPSLTETDTVTEAEADISVYGVGTDTNTIPTKVSNISSNHFDVFWKAYPRKVGKSEARKSWEKTKQKRPPIDIILTVIERQKRSDQWCKDGGRFIPYPARWLNQGRWEDEEVELHPLAGVVSEVTLKNISTGKRWLEKHEGQSAIPKLDDDIGGDS